MTINIYQSIKLINWVFFLLLKIKKKDLFGILYTTSTAYNVTKKKKDNVIQNWKIYIDSLTKYNISENKLQNRNLNCA